MITYMMYARMWMKYNVFLFIEHDVFLIHRFFLFMREAGTLRDHRCIFSEFSIVHRRILDHGSTPSLSLQKLLSDIKKEEGQEKGK